MDNRGPHKIVSLLGPPAKISLPPHQHLQHPQNHHQHHFHPAEKLAEETEGSGGGEGEPGEEWSGVEEMRPIVSIHWL